MRKTVSRIRLLAGIFAVVIAGYVAGSITDALRLPGVDVPTSPAMEALLADTLSPATGPDNATVTVVVFTDYRCAVCRRDHPGVMRVARSHTDTRFVFKEWAVLGPESRRLARLALAAQYQGRYLAVHDALMTQRRASDDDLAEVDRMRLRRDMATHSEDIDRELARISRQAFALGLPGTPAYLVNQRLVVGGLSEAKLRRLVERARRPSGG